MLEKPPFQITLKILNLISQTQELVGELNGFSAQKPSVKLRKENKVRTVHHSLAIEGNSLTEEQMTAILENKRVIGPKKQIIEVKNALKLYDSLEQYNPLKEKDLLAAHKALMSDLAKDAGRFRTTSVGIFKGTTVSHVAPSPKQVPHLMGKLFDFLTKDKNTPWLIKACVFHYELEFIHPFSDGNGRMGRLWQQLLLMKQSPIFEYLSTETLIHQRQREYYKILEQCDRAGDSTLFIEFSLENILKSLEEFKASYRPSKPNISNRIEYAMAHFNGKTFSRKDYLEIHKSISTATASRDLAQAVKDGSLKKMGEKAQAVYSSKNTKA
ncbi:Fic family protein [Bdellovibrio sp.]|uniref:Fic family protein n=1 Tax=Bdellovibrio sp. TaxID=28201 RepID=UPI0039E32C6D